MTMILRLAFVSIDIRLKEFSITIFSHVLILSWHFRAENRSCTTKACENDLAKSLPLESPFFHQRNSVFLAHNQLSDVLNIFFSVSINFEVSLAHEWPIINWHSTFCVREWQFIFCTTDTCNDDYHEFISCFSLLVGVTFFPSNFIRWISRFYLFTFLVIKYSIAIIRTCRHNDGLEWILFFFNLRDWLKIIAFIWNGKDKRSVTQQSNELKMSKPVTFLLSSFVVVAHVNETIDKGKVVRKWRETEEKK